MPEHICVAGNSTVYGEKVNKHFARLCFSENSGETSDKAENYLYPVFGLLVNSDRYIIFLLNYS